MASDPFRLSSLFGFIALVIIVFLLLQAAGLGFDLTPDTTDKITNETAVVSYTSNVTVSEANDRYTVRLFDNETVRNESGDELNEGTDYFFSNQSGEIDFQNTANTTSGENATVTYFFTQKIEDFRDTEPVMQRILDAVGGPMVFVPMITFFGVLLFILTTMAWRALSGSSGMGGGGR